MRCLVLLSSIPLNTVRPAQDDWNNIMNSHMQKVLAHQQQTILDRKPRPTQQQPAQHTQPLWQWQPQTQTQWQPQQSPPQQESPPDAEANSH